jgi:hypothetical protein
LPIAYYQTSCTNGSLLLAGDTANVSDLELVKNTPFLWSLDLFSNVGCREWAHVQEPPILLINVAPRNDMNIDPSAVVFHRLNIPHFTDAIVPTLTSMNKAATTSYTVSKRAAIFFNAR